MKKNITILLSTVFFSLGFSQTKEVKKEKEQPADNVSKIRVFTPSTSVSTQSETYKWCVKTDFFSIVTGEFPIIGEYRIAKNFSVEASAALTYGYLNNTSIFGEDEELDMIDSNNSFIESDEPLMGSAFRGTIKYFPSSDYDAIEGWYFGIQAMTKTTNRGYTDSYNEIKINEKDSRTKTGAAVVIGKQIFTDSNIVWDYYFGAGITNVTHKFYSYDYVTEQITSHENTKSKPNILFGLRIGFGN